MLTDALFSGIPFKHAVYISSTAAMRINMATGFTTTRVMSCSMAGF
jgi:hypothetical protein